MNKLFAKPPCRRCGSTRANRTPGSGGTAWYCTSSGGCRDRAALRSGDEVAATAAVQVEERDQVEHPHYGIVTRIRIARTDGKAMRWSEVQAAFAKRYRQRWAFQMHPPAEYLVDEINAYHLWVLAEGVDPEPFRIDNRPTSSDKPHGGVHYRMTTPCDECPFLTKFAKSGSYPIWKLHEFTRGDFPCHQTADVDDDGRFVPKPGPAESAHCAGALIFLEKRHTSHQMIRIAERLGLYDHERLNMKAKVR